VSELLVSDRDEFRAAVILAVRVEGFLVLAKLLIPGIAGMA
jgi:hypothetical protein